MAQESGGQRGDLVSYFCASMSENTGQRVLCIWVGSQVKGLAWSIGDQVGNCICVYCNQMKWRNLILWLGKPWVWKASVLFIMAMAVGQHLLVSEIIMTSWLINYLQRWITDHLDRRLCHVDPLWSLILSSDYILIVQATFTWALLSEPNGNRASKYICANVEKSSGDVGSHITQHDSLQWRKVLFPPGI